MEILELVIKYGAVNEDNNLTAEEIAKIVKNSELIAKQVILWEKL